MRSNDFQGNIMVQLPSIIKHRQWMYVLKALILLLIIPVWIGIIAPHFKKLPDNFSYHANILSIDDFYDEATKKFQGEHISKTEFSYRVIATNTKYDVIENKFDVKTLSDKPIISITRLYYINPYTWQHVSVPGQQTRQGYLFGPHWADKINFDYWHINYNAPARMKFIDRQTIDGLTVNHYEAHYIADQTANLGNLPGVPEKRGIRAKIKLQLWIEPISGWLIKYQDNTLAVYYDIKTGLEIAPWNMFSNRYTENTVREQVYKATYLKWKLMVVDPGMPGLLFLTALFMLWRGFIQKQPIYISMTVVKTTVNYISILILVILMAGSLYYFLAGNQSTSVYTIGISQCNSNYDHIEAIKGFKDSLAKNGFAAGKNINYIIKNTGSDIINQVNTIQFFQNKKVNIIYSLGTSSTLVAKGMTTRIPIIFSDVSYPEESNIIRSPRKTHSNVTGVRNYLPPAVKFNLFEKIYPNIKVIGYVHQKGDPDSEIEYREYKNLLGDRNIRVIDISATDLSDLTSKLQRQDLNFQALFLGCDALIQHGGGALIAKYGIQHKIPTFSCDEESIRDGVLIGYMANPYLNGEFAGKEAAFILQGAEPSWLRIEQPQTGYLMINLTTAKILGITIPEDILINADYVVGEKS